MTGEELAAKLTAKQRVFVNALAGGKNPSEAYREAYNTTATDRNLSSEAAKLKANPKVQAYLQHLIGKQEQKRFLTRERKREILHTIAESDKAKANERVKAIEVDNVMTGDNAPQRVNVFGLGELLQLVRKGNR